MKLLVTGAFNCSNEQLNTLEALGNEILFMQNEKDELPEEFLEAEGIIGNGIFLYHDIKQFKNLKYIQLTSAGFDRVPMDYIKEHNIEIHNAKGVYSIPMAEFAIGGILQIYKQSRYFYDNQKNHIWNKNRNLFELFGKNVCIFGCGSVGNECAKRLSAFGTKIFGVDIKPYENSNFEKMVTIDTCDEILRISDIVTSCLPLTNETQFFFNKELFSKMKNGSIFVNISRGQIVETDSLISALKDKLLGAVLDVFENEPLEENSPLWDMDNVIVTPHNSFVGEGNNNRLFNVIKSNLQRFYGGYNGEKAFN